MTWNALRHPNVLPLLGVTMTENLFVVVLEWMVKGNINEFVKVTHGSAKKMPTELVKTLSQNASIVGRYIGEHRVFTPTILVIL